MMNQRQLKEYAPAIVRISLSLVFLWFSFNQFFLTNNFIDLIPSWVVSLSGISPDMFVILNAILEFAFGMFLLLGIHVRLSAFILGLHLLGIAFSLGYGTTMIRDLGLALATLSICFQGNDILCIGKKKTSNTETN